MCLSIEPYIYVSNYPRILYQSTQHMKSYTYTHLRSVFHGANVERGTRSVSPKPKSRKHPQSKTEAPQKDAMRVQDLDCCRMLLSSLMPRKIQVRNIRLPLPAWRVDLCGRPTPPIDSTGDRRHRNPWKRDGLVGGMDRLLHSRTCPIQFALSWLSVGPQLALQLALSWLLVFYTIS